MKFISLCLSYTNPQIKKIFAHMLATLSFKIFRVRRRLILSNLEKAFSSELSLTERTSIAYQSVYHFMLTVIEFVAARRGDLAANVSFEGEQYLTEALAQGSGVYILCCHMGNWETMGAAINKAFAPAHVVVKKVGSNSMNRFVCEQRELNGFRIIDRSGSSSANKLIKDTLKRKEIVGFVMDQSRPNEEKIPFFGHPAKTNSGLSILWRRNPVPLVPAHIERIAVDHHVVKFGPAIEPIRSKDIKQDLKQLTQRFNHEIENIIKQKPEQYFWFHNRWKV
ncbi:MAG: lysophospholipid acyltransferase family protein [Bdellovibrionota bacterium]